MSTFLNASPIFGPVRSRRLGLSLGVNNMTHCVRAQTYTLCRADVVRIAI